MNQKLRMISDFRNIVLQNRALVDVRAPIEFEKGAFPCTINLPLMDDQERDLIGKLYKKAGNSKALELGYQLISGSIKDSRIQAWVEYIHNNPNTLIYCSRGGQRSEIAQKWLGDAGLDVARLRGGYKAFRNYLIDELDNIPKQKKIIIIGGHTGSGKTILLQKIKESIDLEEIANHRGSSFGHFASIQPTQINFENALAYRLIEQYAAEYRYIFMEDESKNIGRCRIPNKLFEYIKTARLILLETSLNDRIDITYNEYIIMSQTEYSTAFHNGHTKHSWIDVMRHNFYRIRKRLGDKNYRELTVLLNHAWTQQEKTNNPSLHKVWIEKLLTRYYDPMYEYQLSQKQERVIFRGNNTEILEYTSTL
ncbi:MAG: tRNA 2-selenouridine(34) synthase MnmH [Sulfurovum sp.]|nr:tRNA 2-selenouridine(34) synthase MnmH [Sulfurovum sp.]